MVVLVYEHVGICIADDTSAILLSPELYQTFDKPYTNVIAKHFGGAYIHSCGGYMHNLDEMAGTEGVKGIQLHAGPGEFILPRTCLEDCAFNRVRERLTVFVDTNPISRGNRYANDSVSFYREELLPCLRACPPGGLILDACISCKDIAQYAADTNRTREILSQTGQ